MRKPRDYDAELRALEQRAKSLRQRRVQQLGELVIASGANALDPEILAGALAHAVSADAAAKEAWRTQGRSLFRRSRGLADRSVPDPRTAASGDLGSAPPAGEDRA